MALTYWGKRGILRIQSAPVSASSNHYFEVGFVNMDLSGPMGRGKPEEIPVLDRGILTSTAHFIQGPDDILLAPLNVTFTARLDDSVNRQKLYDAMGNPSNTTPWTVGGLSFARTNGRSQIFNGSGVAVSTPATFLAQERIDLVVLWRGGTPGTNDEGFAFREVYFPLNEVRVNEAQDMVTIAATGWTYGAVSHITVFSSGSAV